jgi:hypothetical protein
MNLEDLLRFLQPGDPEAAAYLNDPNSRPEIGRTRPPMFPAPPRATLAPDGMRLPLPRIQGTGAVNRMQKAPAYPMAFGPGAGATPPQQPQGRPQLQFPATAPVMRFRDATATVGPAMVDQPMQTVSAPWAQPAQIEAGPAVSENRLPIGAPPLQRGLEPPSAARAPVDEDAEWNAASARVRAAMGRDPTQLRQLAEDELRPLRSRAERSRMVANTAPRNWPRATR